MAYKGKLMAMAHMPVDEQLLAAIGRVTIRHGFLDWTLNRTIKTLTGIKPNQADYVLGGEGSASLRRKVRTIAAIRFGKGSETYKKLKKIIDACDKVTSRRNDFVHSVWVEVEGNASLLDLRTRNRKPLPKVNEIDSLAKQIHELAERLNEARAKKGFVAVALKEPNTTGVG